MRPITALVAAGTAVVILLTLAGFAARLWWRFELASHFRLQYACLLLLAALYLLVCGRRALAGLALAGVVVNAACVLPIYAPRRESVSVDGTHLRIISFNVLGKNNRHEEVLQFLRSEQANIVLLMEISPQWARAVKSLSDEYPHQHVVPRTDNFGIALLSREPWQAVRTLELGDSEEPSIVAEFGDGDFTFVGTHPLPPGSAGLAAVRNNQLLALGEYVANLRPRRIILAGDLNVTSYSPFFTDLLHQTGLVDTRQGFGLQASWGPFRFLEIPIDHCLVSPEMHVLRRRVGGHLGSDHRPVIVDLLRMNK